MKPSNVETIKPQGDTTPWFFPSDSPFRGCKRVAVTVDWPGEARELYMRELNIGEFTKWQAEKTDELTAQVMFLAVSLCLVDGTSLGLEYVQGLPKSRLNRLAINSVDVNGLEFVDDDDAEAERKND